MELVLVNVYRSTSAYATPLARRLPSGERTFVAPAFELCVQLYGIELGYGFAPESGLPAMYRCSVGSATHANRVSACRVESFPAGETALRPNEVRAVVERMGRTSFRRRDYHVLHNNSFNFACVLLRELQLARPHAVPVRLNGFRPVQRLANDGHLPNAVHLNVYDVGTSAHVWLSNKLTHSVLGVGGAFHAAVQVYGLEWSFGWTGDGSSGVFRCAPRANDDHRYSCTLLLGLTALTREQVYAVLARLRSEWLGSQYELLSRNCCHFCEVFAAELGPGVAPVPRWINRLSRAGRQASATKRLGTAALAGVDATASAGAGAAQRRGTPLAARVTRLRTRLVRIAHRARRKARGARGVAERAATPATPAGEESSAAAGTSAASDTGAEAQRHTLCLECLAAAAGTVCVPCNHCVLCFACATSYRRRGVRVCPLCVCRLRGIRRARGDGRGVAEGAAPQS